jgi:hypothetical protein
MKCKLLFAALLIGNMSFAQLLNPAPFVAGAEADANYLGGEYLSPFGKALANGLNNAWYTTAKTHKTGRFDVMFHPTLVFIPETDRTFEIDETRLEELQLVDPNVSTAQTAAGEDSEGPARLEYQNSLISTQFDAPAGTGVRVLPYVTAQVNVGLPFNTDISIRYIPTVDIPFVEGAQVGMYGFGIKHDIVQWFGLDKVLPIDISIQANYSQLDFNAPIEGGDDGKEIVMSSRGYSARALISKKLAFLTVYGAAGYNGGTTDINLNGTYSFTNPSNPTENVEVQDPVATSVEANGMVGQLGLRLKFLYVMCFSADYTFGAYNSVTAGLGVSIDF